MLVTVHLPASVLYTPLHPFRQGSQSYHGRVIVATHQRVGRPPLLGLAWSGLGEVFVVGN
jgi:hypothetical protein